MNRSQQGGLGAVELAGLGLLVVVVPVVFDPFGRSGLLAVKVLAASLGVVLLGASLVRARAVVVPWGRIAAVASASLMVVGVSTLLSPAWERSLLGAPQRMSGLLMWLCVAAAFVAGLSLRWRRGESAEAAVMHLSVVAVLAAGLLAMLEVAGAGGAFAALEFEGRLRSGLGNPSVLASFVLLVGPLCVAAAALNGRWRWPAMAACGLGGVMLVGSQSRGAIVAFGVTAAVFAAARSSKPLRYWVIAGTAALLAATAAIGRWGELGFGLRGRVAIWEVAFDTIADRPLLGAGPEMFLVEYSERVGANTVREFGRQSVIDRAHGGLLDFAVSSGVVAAVLYFAVLAAVGVLAVKAMSSSKPAPAALGAGMVAYIVQQQVFFPHPAVDAVFWLFAGIVAAAVGVRGRPVRSLLVAIAAACVVLGSVANSLSMMRNDHDFERARTAKTYEAAYRHLSDAADRRSFDDEPYILMGVLLQTADDSELIARGEARIRRGESLNPGNELVSLALAEVRLQGFRLSDDPVWALRAQAGLDDLIEAQPTNTNAYLKRGVAWYHLEEFESAEADWQQTAWLSPNDPVPHDNLEVLRQRRAIGGGG
ncbi:O-antigen ligase family protein [Candidatus Poriferisocius sp.]|uniref:O-antigen ligase family protein n=1 Tax=Candidatus Poriferisocius sp. TaxID=3101276 RepID=UPI003B02B6C3